MHQRESRNKYFKRGLYDISLNRSVRIIAGAEISRITVL